MNMTSIDKSLLRAAAWSGLMALATLILLLYLMGVI